MSLSEQSAIEQIAVDNPYIHGTSSATLSLMKNTEFQLMPIIPMIEKYRLAPMVGELHQGGYATIGSDGNHAALVGAPAFGLVHSSRYNLGRITSDYARQNDVTTLSDAKECLESYINNGHKLAYSNLNLLIIYAVRFQQLGGGPKHVDD